MASATSVLIVCSIPKKEHANEPVRSERQECSGKNTPENVNQQVWIHCENSSITLCTIKVVRFRILKRKKCIHSSGLHPDSTLSLMSS
ncbi:unnamed protein product [Gongylonema pulchrum]|uniref:Secreted protein n=1 Tax=Gongylonema pulchrum TaxID=637853 RepID=A0A183DHG2_9BILA|nr:unnamed protein product [Gongylonema pulchrum]VDK61030.1 unnamed protein product [Gongylonema pulchrum]